MRRRVVVAVSAVVMSFALAAPGALAADSLKMYRATVDAGDVATLERAGVDLGESGYRPSVERAQTIEVDLFDAQARSMRDAGIALDELTPGPHVSEAQIERRIDRRRRPTSPRRAATRRTRSTTSSAPTRSRSASRPR